MKIESFLPLPESHKPALGGATNASSANSRTGKSGLKQDEATLSVDRDTVQLLESKLSHLPDVRQERVEALQRVISEGRYNVSSEQIAGAVFSELLE